MDVFNTPLRRLVILARIGLIQEARSALVSASAAAVGAGTLKPADARKLIADWRKTAEAQAQHRVRSEDALQLLSAMGYVA